MREEMKDLKMRRMLLQLALLPVALVLGVTVAYWWNHADDEMAAFEQAVPSLSYEHTNHLHGIGLDTDRQRLLLATHYGLFGLEGGQLYQLGERRDDFMGLSVDPHNPLRLFVSGHPPRGGNLGVLYSEDGGVSFTQVLSGVNNEVVDFHAMAISPVDTQRVYGFYAGQLYRTVDAGNAWQLPAMEGLSGQGFCWGAPCLAADGHEADMIYAGTANGVMVSHDGGEQWRLLSERTGAVAAIGSDMHNDQRLIAHTAQYGVAVSLDGGASWEAINEGLNFGQNDVVFAFLFDPQRPDVAYLATTANQVYRTEDLGVGSWERVL